jgi:hypothetical protein
MLRIPVGLNIGIQG